MGFTPFASLAGQLAGATIPGNLTVAGSITTTGLGAIIASGNLQSQLGSLTVTTGQVDVANAGSGLQVKEGANAKQGIATLVAGTVTVADTSVTANSRIQVTGQSAGGTPGGVNVSTRTAGTSFTITSTNAADTSVAGYEIFEPG